MPELKTFRETGGLSTRYWCSIVVGAQHATTRVKDHVVSLLDRHSFILQAFALWLVTRVALLAFTYATLLLRPDVRPLAPPALMPHALLASWQRWDASWYIHIAQHGYYSEPAAAFFPLYPALIRAVTLVIGQRWLTAALLVANVGTLAGFIGLAALAAHDEGSRKAASPVIRMVAAYPLACFLAAPYTEGLFLALASFGLLAMRRGAWAAAVGCTCLALLTRPTGLVLLPPLIWEYARQQVVPRYLIRDGRRWSLRIPPRSLAWMALGLSAAPLTLGIYMTYLWRRYGDPLFFLVVERQYWHHEALSALRIDPAVLARDIAATMWTYEQARALVDLAPIALCALLIVVIARRLPVYLTLYMAGLLMLSIASPRPDRIGIFVSAGRYLSMSVPVYIMLGRWSARRPWLDLLLVGGGFLAQAVLTTFFLTGGWLV